MTIVMVVMMALCEDDAGDSCDDVRNTDDPSNVHADE